MPLTNHNIFLALAKVCLNVLIVLAALATNALRGQDRVVIVRHGSTPEGDIIRAKADAVLILKHAELIGEKAIAKRLDNMIKACDVAYKQFATRKQIRKEALADKFDRKFDIIRFNQQLTEIRDQLEQQAITRHTRIGDLTDEMNNLLERFARRSINASRIAAMKIDLSPEQIDAIYLSDGSNTFSGKTGKTRLETFKWPFFLQRKEFEKERNDFETSCEQAIMEIDSNHAPSPETILGLAETLAAMGSKLDNLPVSQSADVRLIETKWRKEAKNFIRELNHTLGNTSKLDSEKLSKYVFQGKTLGELIDHLDSKGLRFSPPNTEDANLYASVFLIMRFVYVKYGESTGKAPASPDKPPPGSKGAETDEKKGEASSSKPAANGSISAQPQDSTKPQQPATAKRVSLVAPYPPKYTPKHASDKISVQYAVMALCDQVGFGYDWNASATNAGSACRQWVRPQLHNVPWHAAMDQLLSPLGLTYEIRGKTVVLKRP